MISAIIIVGISLKLAIILVLIRTSVGFSAMFQRLKQTLTFAPEEPEIGWLAAGLIRECEARAAQAASESVEETTLLEEAEQPAAAPKRLEGFFSLLKHKADSQSAGNQATRALPAHRLSKTQAPRAPLQPALPGLLASPQARVAFKAPHNHSADFATAPVALLGSLLLRQVACMAGARCAGPADGPQDSRSTRTADRHKQQQQHHQQPQRPVPAHPRSRLAVKLEKKLESLEARVSQASTQPRQEVLQHKLEKLSRCHSKRLAQSGRAELPVVHED